METGAHDKEKPAALFRLSIVGQAAVLRSERKLVSGGSDLSARIR